MDLDQHLAERIRDLRKARGYTLERLAELSEVSRSMISLIERGETSPTAAVLNKLADALHVTLASLFSGEFSVAPASPLARAADQQVWTDPETGYKRRHLSPSGFPSPIDLVEIVFPPGKSVAFDQVSRHVVTHQQVWIMEGEMQITANEKTWRLRSGDCLAMTVGERVVFKNPTRKPARYVLALTSASPARRL
ncbi:MAG TPA: XRE family transcriptional regulator [Burkholderiaceae bacterium]|nr:XRE family transcriptional regulator [Burkholderiaceae bacterium]